MKSDLSYEDGRLIITRLFDAPREAVFQAWIETSKVELWWGWVTARFTAEEPMPEPLWQKWLDESYALSGVKKSKKKAKLA